MSIQYPIYFDVYGEIDLPDEDFDKYRNLLELEFPNVIGVRQIGFIPDKEHYDRLKSILRVYEVDLVDRFNYLIAKNEFSVFETLYKKPYFENVYMLKCKNGKYAMLIQTDKTDDMMSILKDIEGRTVELFTKSLLTDKYLMLMILSDNFLTDEPNKMEYECKYCGNSLNNLNDENTVYCSGCGTIYVMED